MSDGYTPETRSVRIAYVYIDTEDAEDIKQQRGEAFDRWLASVKAEAKAEQAAEDAAFARAWLARMHRESPAKAFPDALETAIRAAAENEGN